MIIFIGRFSVALGIIVSLITVSTGYGSKRAIKERMADFAGHVSIKSKQSNNSYNSSVLQNEGFQRQQIQELNGIAGTQNYVSVSGILRNEDGFSGIIYKGIGKDFDAERFKKFLISGTTPTVTEKGFNSGITISKKIADELHLKVKDSIVAIFSRDEQQPVYRKFEVVGIYKTDIKMIDDLFVIGGINHARRILGMKENEVGGMDVFLDNINELDAMSPQIDKLVGYKNYTEKATEKYPQIVDFIAIFDMNILLIIVIMLVVVIINIIMVLLILIIERTNSIGMLKTLGATNQQIRAIFINYTLMIMIPGLIFGNLIGIGFLLIQKYFGVIQLNPENYYLSTVPVDLNILHILAISLGILTVSAISLILPSYLISKISPVKAIKYD